MKAEISMKELVEIFETRRQELRKLYDAANEKVYDCPTHDALNERARIFGAQDELTAIQLIIFKHADKS